MEEKKVTFVTTNKHKFEEVQALLKDYPIELEQTNMEYPENHDDSLEEIARDGAKYMVEKLKKPVIVEDTGIFFKAYDNFPGALPKFVFLTLGFKGIFKLLEEENRGAYFETVAAYAEPGQEVYPHTQTISSLSRENRLGHSIEGESKFSERGVGVKIFRGRLQGIITDQIFNEEKDVMPYDKIFIPENKTVTISDMTMKEKNIISQRSEAFRKFGEYIRQLS